MSFKFELDQCVQIKASGETGEVIGRAEYPKAESAYYIRYKAGDGRAVEAWWNESALKITDSNPQVPTPAGPLA